MYKYVCLSCKTPISSRVPLTYCVCGGKYGLTMDDILKSWGDLFGKDNPFSVSLGKNNGLGS